MCGIAGVVGEFSAERLNVALRAMLAAQAHRGPDDSGALVFAVAGGQYIGLGNQRLAIQDISPLGHQPMINPDTGDVLVYNGEIYNAPELRRILRTMGFQFRGCSDTEVLLRAYERWGRECLDRLRGMFALALWDARRGRLIVARDHIGIKPFYYASIPGRGFVFASEIRAILSGGLIPFQIDERALAGYLAYGAVQEPLTILQGVFTLPAGWWMEIDPLGRVVDEDCYWSIPAPRQENRWFSSSNVVEQGRELLEQSVRRHLLSDVPLGVFLSSGLDSTAVLGLARKAAIDQVHAFTVSFPDDPKTDEASIARETARRLGVIYHECPVDSTTALRWTERFLDSGDQPAMDGLNAYMVSRAVKEQGITVALSGQGGDEVFAGYSSFRGVPQWQRMMSWIGWLSPERRAALSQFASIPMPNVVRSKLRDMATTGPDLLGIYFHYRRLLSDQDLKRLGIEAQSLDLTPTFHLPTLDTHQYVVPGDPVATVGRLESVFYLGNTLLRDGDVNGMASSLEIRVPLLDRDVMEWAFQLPGSVLLPRGAPGKFLLRQMCSEFYVSAQTRQKKRGFTPPYGLWLLGPLREVMEECLRSVKHSGLLAPTGVDYVRDLFLREPHSAAWSRVWGLTTLGNWLSKHQPTAARSSAA